MPAISRRSNPAFTGLPPRVSTRGGGKPPPMSDEARLETRGAANLGRMDQRAFVDRGAGHVRAQMEMDRLEFHLFTLQPFQCLDGLVRCESELGREAG